MKKHMITGLGLGLAVSLGPLAAQAVLLSGGSGNDTLTGTAAADVLFGDPAASTAAPTSIERLSVYAGSGAQMAEGAAPGNFSADGKKMVLTTSANNVVAGVPAGIYSQVYVKDLVTGAYTLVSSTGAGAVGTNGDSYEPFISPDGKKVVFVTKAGNLSGNGTFAQIVVKDLTSGALTVLSKNPNNTLSNGTVTGGPVFSPDGTAVAFYSNANGLVTADSNNNPDIFLVKYTGSDSDYTSMRLVSATIGGEPEIGGGTYGNDSASQRPVFAPDGKSIAFASNGPDLLLPGDPDNNAAGYDIFIKVIPDDALTSGGGTPLSSAITLVSALADGTQDTMCDNHSPAFSPSGKQIAFVSECDDLLGASPASEGIDINGAYEDVFVKTVAANGDWRTGAISLVSRDAFFSQGTQPSAMALRAIRDVTFSPDGTKIAFASNQERQTGALASAFVDSPASTDYYIYVKTLANNGIFSGDLALASPCKIGDCSVTDDWITRSPLFTPDGAGLAFSSSANNLVAGDTNNNNDIFLAALPAASGGNDSLNGGAGADFMVGGAGNDTYTVDNAADLVVERASGGTDLVKSSVTYTLPDHVENLTLTGSAALNGTGNAGANTLTGNTGANKLIGGAGKDRLIGGKGRDTLTGGTGADTFVFSSTAHSLPGKKKRDTITDFNAKEKDVIDVSGIDADTRRRKNQKFTFIGSSAFTGVAGQLRFANGILAGDTNGDGRADFEVKVTVTQGKLTAKRLKL